MYLFQFFCRQVYDMFKSERNYIIQQKRYISLEGNYFN